jgi:hypothetical protein
MISIFSSLASGGILGAIGSGITNLFDFLKQKQANKQALEVRKLEIAVTDKRHEHELTLAGMKQTMDLQKGADKIQAASYGTDRATYTDTKSANWVSQILLTTVDVLRGLVRPAMTGYMVWEVHVLRSSVEAILTNSGVTLISAPQALAIYGDIVNMILFLASASFSWWFGTRIKNKAVA